MIAHQLLALSRYVGNPCFDPRPFGLDRGQLVPRIRRRIAISLRCCPRMRQSTNCFIRKCRRNALRFGRRMHRFIRRHCFGPRHVRRCRCIAPARIDQPAFCGANIVR